MACFVSFRARVLRSLGADPIHGRLGPRSGSRFDAGVHGFPMLNFHHRRDACIYLGERWLLRAGFPAALLISRKGLLTNDPDNTLSTFFLASFFIIVISLFSFMPQKSARTRLFLSRVDGIGQSQAKEGRRGRD